MISHCLRNVGTHRPFKSGCFFLLVSQWFSEVYLTQYFLPPPVAYKRKKVISYHLIFPNFFLKTCLLWGRFYIFQLYTPCLCFPIPLRFFEVSKNFCELIVPVQNQGGKVSYFHNAQRLI